MRTSVAIMRVIGDRTRLYGFRIEYNNKFMLCINDSMDMNVELKLKAILLMFTEYFV